MKKNYLILLLSIISFSYGVQAQAVNPIAATTTFTAKFGTALTNAYNGAGLSTTSSVTATHEGTHTANSFIANELTGIIDFDLGTNATYSIDGIAFWNQNLGGPNINVGINGVNFFYSTDGTTYMPIPGAPTSFAIGGAQPAQPETFTFTKIDAKYIRMTVNSSHGGTSIGFAEIAFATGGVLDTHSVFTETSKKIYPNPSSDFIQIPELKTTENYSLHNNLGQEIKSGIVSKNEKIDIRDLADGYYYLKFKEGNAMKFIKK